MKKSIFALAAITTLAASANASVVFTLDPSFTSGDSTATWNYTDGVTSGVLTATSTMATGFTAAFDSSTIGNIGNLNGSNDNVGMTNGGGVFFGESSPGTISYSYTAGTGALLGDLYGGIASFDDAGGNTISVANGGSIFTTYNGNNMTNATTGASLAAGDQINTITGDNSNGIFLYERQVFNTVLEFGGTNNLTRNTILSFGNQAFVPEPSSTALLGLGALSLLARRKR